MNTANDLTINKLRLSNAVENSPALRIRLCRWMESLQVKPANIPPSAVLIIRQLGDPLPKRLDLSLNSARIDSTWERAVQNKLSEVFRQAARPSLGSVSANAVAVVFPDEAEMFACLALDLIRSEASGNWWWRTFLRSMRYSVTDNITKLLCERPILVPAILHHLAERGQVETVVAGLSSEQTFRILVAVNRAYALPDLPQDKHGGPSPILTEPESESEAVNGILSSGNTYSDKAKTRQEHASALASPTTRHRIDVEMPWYLWLPSGLVPTHLPKEKTCLLGVGLTLHYAPAAARSETFLRKLHKWWMAPSLSSFTSSLAETPKITPLTPAQKFLSDEHLSSSDSPKDSVEHLSQETPQIIEVGVAKTSAAKATTPRAVLGEAPPLDTGDVLASAVAVTSDGSLIEEFQANELNSSSVEVSRSSLNDEPSKEQINLSVTKHQPALEDSSLLLEGGADTQLGGALYLINLMAELDLPQCFEEEWGLASQLGAWGVLEILARTMIDNPDESLSHDALWQVLAELDGRDSDELPGATFQGSECFHLPAAWPKYVGDDANGIYAWGTDGDRYCLWSGQGYVLAEDASIDPLAILSRYFHGGSVNLSQQSYINAPIVKVTNALLSGLNPDLKSWLTFVMPYVRLRLQQALRGALDLKALLLYPGRIYITSTHVDLVLSLKNVSIPVRMAGLDLDPGWVPDFGRIVLFHFE
ncbi:hypothetical protein [Nitrosomonas ureae]|uniref:Uncharacterized protein n=1 Tax=Nitrosomonas ureae TaxID=44577 RepID=A0A1H9D0F5_9PROT|nr:hypothetical protein [Nitrosomonas ureae]SEQ06982.1 hypothetical protein SAMN05421510_101827 [Nitrosomonas ureae]